MRIYSVIHGKNHFIYLLAALVPLLAGCAAHETSPTPAPLEAAASQPPLATQRQNGFRMVSMEEALSIMDGESDFIILDVRTAEEFYERHIPGALNVPNEAIGSGEIPELPDKDQLILVYCRSGNRSKQASSKLAALGYTNIVEFGGINDWPGETVSGS